MDQMEIQRYKHNLSKFKEMIDQYTMADLENMIYNIQDSNSGGCCYPAMQTLISLMEMLGKIISDETEAEAIKAFLNTMDKKYTNITDFYNTLYDLFRNGIAHSSLVKGGVTVRKSGCNYDGFHLSNNGKNIDVKILFQDFIHAYKELFDRKLIDPQYLEFYRDNLKAVLKGLKMPYLTLKQPTFVINNDTYTTISGTLTSGASGPALY